MDKCLGKLTACGLERGFDPTAMMELAASVAGRGAQWAEGSQPLHDASHWVYLEPNGEG
jgi:hypothetical protein